MIHGGTWAKKDISSITVTVTSEIAPLVLKPTLGSHKIFYELPGDHSEKRGLSDTIVRNVEL
jgi:hypothetical protein